MKFENLRQKCLLGATVLVLSAISSMAHAGVPSSGNFDCKSIQEKIDAAASKGGGKVVISAGNYVCHEPIIIQNDNIELVGEELNCSSAKNSKRSECKSPTIGARNLVNIKIADNANIPAFIIGSPDTVRGKLENYIPDIKTHPVPGWDPNKEDSFTPKRVKNVKLRNFSVDGNTDKQFFDPARGDAGECWDDPKTPEVDNCKADGKAAIRNNGITIRGADDIEISDVVLDKNRSGGLVTEKYCRRLKVTRMKASNNFFDGFAGYQTVDSVFQDSVWAYNRGAGASLDIDFSHNTFRNIEFRNNKHQGIFARNLNNLKVENSKLVGNGYQGVFLAADGKFPCPSYVSFHNTEISGSGSEDRSQGVGIRLNDNECPNNCIGKGVTFGARNSNPGGDISWSGKVPGDIIREGTPEYEAMKCRDGKQKFVDEAAGKTQHK